MSKHARASVNPGTGATGGAATAVAFEPVTEAPARATPVEREDIARLAYAYWEARGCPYGSPEEDWFRAEMELLRHSSAAAE